MSPAAELNPSKSIQAGGPAPAISWPSGPGGSPAAGPDGRSMCLPARMSLIFAGRSFWPGGRAPQNGPSALLSGRGCAWSDAAHAAF